MRSQETPHEFAANRLDPTADASNSENPNAAKSSTTRRPRLIGRLLFAWSWFVASALLLIVAPPVLLISIPLKRQDWIYWWANWGARTWLRLSGVKVRVVGREQNVDPNQTYVFVANHWSYLDAAPLFAYTGRRMGMIAKKELLNAPILGYGMGFVNVVAIDRSNKDRAVQSLTVATERLRSGISFGVCPEGTRAKPGEMLPFKKGAFHMAAQAGVPIAPIALKNTDVLMGKGTGEAWPGTIEMVFLPPVDTSWVKSDKELDELVQEVQGMIMKELGIERLSQRESRHSSTKS